MRFKDAYTDLKIANDVTMNLFKIEPTTTFRFERLRKTAPECVNVWYHQTRVDF
jgi:hypothetical protein